MIIEIKILSLSQGVSKFQAMKIGICSDHAGFEYKGIVMSYLLNKGYDVVNFGTDSPESCDYPDYAHQLAQAVSAGEVEKGIAICGTGNGMAITLNHHKDIRAGLAWNVNLAHLVKEHNDANILVLPARFISRRMAVMMVREWLLTAFAGGRHQRRIDKITL